MFTSALLLKHKSFFIISCVSNEAVAVNAMTGTVGPARERSSPSLPYDGLNAGRFVTGHCFPLKQ